MVWRLFEAPLHKKWIEKLHFLCGARRLFEEIWYTKFIPILNIYQPILAIADELTKYWEAAMQKIADRDIYNFAVGIRENNT